MPVNQTPLNNQQYINTSGAVNAGQILVSNGNVSASWSMPTGTLTANTISWTTAAPKAPDDVLILAASKDTISVRFVGFTEQNDRVVMLLEPEDSITVKDMLKIQKLIAYSDAAERSGNGHCGFNPFAYAMKSGIIQHFKLGA
jgi:hypothetical protein